MDRKQLDAISEGIDGGLSKAGEALAYTLGGYLVGRLIGVSGKAAAGIGFGFYIYNTKWSIK